jgi:hypothetical protein
VLEHLEKVAFGKRKSQLEGGRCYHIRSSHECPPDRCLLFMQHLLPLWIIFPPDSYSYRKTIYHRFPNQAGPKAFLVAASLHEYSRPHDNSSGFKEKE